MGDVLYHLLFFPVLFLQFAVHFTQRIRNLTEHLKENRKDFGTERALTALVGKRRRMLDYLKAKDIERYRAIIKELGIRK